MSDTLEIFCAYCRNFKDADAGFRLVLHVESGTRRQQCGRCTANRRKSPADLQALIERDAADRRLTAQARGRLAQKLKKEKLK